MRPTMTRKHTHEDVHLLDAEAWDTPHRLSDEDLHSLDLHRHEGTGWRGVVGLFDPEDAR